MSERNYHNWTAITSAGFYPFAADTSGITDKGELALPAFISDLKINAGQDDNVFLNFVRVSEHLISIGLAVENSGISGQLAVITTDIEQWRTRVPVPVKTIENELIGWITPGAFQYPHENITHTYSTYQQSKLSEHCIYRDNNNGIIGIKTTNSKPLIADVGFHLIGDAFVETNGNAIKVMLTEEAMKSYVGLPVDADFVRTIGNAVPINGKIIIRFPDLFDIEEMPSQNESGVNININLPMGDLCSRRIIDTPELFTETDPPCPE